MINNFYGFAAQMKFKLITLLILLRKINEWEFCIASSLYAWIMDMI